MRRIRRIMRIAFPFATVLGILMMVAPAQAQSVYRSRHGFPYHAFNVRCAAGSYWGTYLAADPVELQNFYGVDEVGFPQDSPSDPYKGPGWRQSVYYRVWVSVNGKWWKGAWLRMTGDHPSGLGVAPDYQTTNGYWVDVPGGYFGENNFAVGPREAWLRLSNGAYYGWVYTAVETYWENPTQYPTNYGGPYAGSNHFDYNWTYCQ
jgi:hypothetical protein